MTSTDTLAAREYLRVSVDHTGKKKSIARQHTENVKEADRVKIRLSDKRYEETGSASQYRNKERAKFDEMLQDLRNDTFEEDLAWFWETSRLSRDVAEWGTFISLCRERGKKIYVTTHHRIYDPANHRDRKSMRDDASHSAYWADEHSIRVRSGIKDSAEAGGPHGRKPYGYDRRYDPETRELVEQFPKDGEAENVKELFDRLKKGHTFYAIEKDWEQRGIKTRSGKKFTSRHLLTLARNPAYAGLRVYDPNRKGHKLSDSAQMIGASWDPLVDLRTFYAVQRILGDPKRTTRKPGKGVHLLSGIALCDKCRGPLTIYYPTEDKDTPWYKCKHGSHVRVRKANLDEVAEKAVLDYLTRPDVLAAMAAQDETADSELQEVRDELEQKRARDEQLTQKLTDALADGLDETDIISARNKVRARITELETRERELSTPEQLRGLIDLAGNVRAHWRKLPMSAKRAIARMLLSEDYLGELRLTRRCAKHRNVACPAEDRAYIVRATTGKKAA